MREDLVLKAELTACREQMRVRMRILGEYIARQWRGSLRTKAGTRVFADYAREMTADLGEEYSVLGVWQIAASNKSLSRSYEWLWNLLHRNLDGEFDV